MELEAYWYTKELPRVVDALGDAGLKTVLPWLVEYEQINKAIGEDFDHSGFARHSVAEPHDDAHDVEDALIAAVRACAIAAFSSDASAAWKLLARRAVLIIERIAMHALTKVLEAATDQEAPRLVAIGSEMLLRPKCRDEAAKVEFVALARELADRSERRALAIAIEEGHFTEADRILIRTNMAARGETVGAIEASIARWDERWRHQVLSGVGRDLLTPALVVELDRLDATHGKLEDPLTPSFQVTSWVGPNSPVEQAEMIAMSPSQLLAQLESWHVSGDQFGPSPSHEGQARVLTAVLTANPQALAGAYCLAERLRPTYVRAALAGWEAAYKANLDLDWSVVMDTLADVVTHGRESQFLPEGEQGDDDTDFEYAKRAAVGLLEELSKPKNAGRITPERLATISNLILEASGDQAAWVDYASSGTSSSGMDPLTTSLNWQWPNMLRALVNLISHGLKTDWYDASSTALRRELDRDDPSGASRAVLGEGLGRLYAGARDWLSQNLVTYFGSADSLTRDQQIALTTAIAVHNYHPSLYRLLSGSMTAALGEADLAVGWRTQSTPKQNIGQWVVEGIVRGDIAEEDKLRQAFYEIGAPKIRGDAIGHIAWTFLHAKVVDDEIRDRLGELWDERVRHVELNLSDKAELKDFYWFIRCGKFDAGWWLPRLRRALELDPELDTHGMIGEQLAEAASVLPADAFAALTRLLKSDDTPVRDNWDLRSNALVPVIAAAIESGNPALEREATDLMNAMGGRGEIDLDRRVAELRTGPNS